MKTKHKITLQPGDHANRHDMTEEQYRECVQRMKEDGMPEGGEKAGGYKTYPFFGWAEGYVGLFHSMHGGGLRFTGRLLTHAEIIECAYEAEVGDVFEVTKCELAGARLGVGSKVTVEECNGRGGFFVDTSNMLFNDHINNGLKYVCRVGDPQYDPDDVAFKRDSVGGGGWKPEVGKKATCDRYANPVEMLFVGDKLAVCRSDFGDEHCTDVNNFRPLKSPRDRWVDEAMKQCRTLSKHDCQAIYDAGLAGGVE